MQYLARLLGWKLAFDDFDERPVMYHEGHRRHVYSWGDAVRYSIRATMKGKVTK